MKILHIIILLCIASMPFGIVSYSANAQENIAMSKTNNENATNDYYNESYLNQLLPSNQSGANTTDLSNITEWNIDLSNNGWSFAQSWLQTEDNQSNAYATFSDNGGRNYSAPLNICPGAIDKRTGIYGPEYWLLCTKNTNGVDNMFWQEVRTQGTPFSALTNISVDKMANAQILDFKVNPNTGSVVATWFEQPTPNNNKTSQQDPIHTKCFRC